MARTRLLPSYTECPRQVGKTVRYKSRSPWKTWRKKSTAWCVNTQTAKQRACGQRSYRAQQNILLPQGFLALIFLSDGAFFSSTRHLLAKTDRHAYASPPFQPSLPLIPPKAVLSGFHGGVRLLRISPKNEFFYLKNKKAML